MCVIDRGVGKAGPVSIVLKQCPFLGHRVCVCVFVVCNLLTGCWWAGRSAPCMGGYIRIVCSVACVYV